MQDLAHTIRKRLAAQPGFSAPKRPPHCFGIDHYAGQVKPCAVRVEAAEFLPALRQDFEWRHLHRAQGLRS